MQRIRIGLVAEDTQAAAVALTQSGAFHPEVDESSPGDSLPESPGDAYRALYASARSRYAKLESRLGRAAPGDACQARIVSFEELDALNEKLGIMWREVSDLEEQQRSLHEALRSVKNLRDSLEKFAKLNIDLGLLHRQGRFLDLRIGTVPITNAIRLEAAAAFAGYFARAFHTTENSVYVVVAGPADSSRQIAGLLEAADFHAVEIPVEFKDHPDRIDRELAEKGMQLEKKVVESASALGALGERYADDIALARDTLCVALPYGDMATGLRGRGGLALIEGWAPMRNVTGIRRRLDASLANPYVMHVRDPDPGERSRVPSVIRHPRLLQPFADLVRNYGVPRYREFDPTVLFTLSFVVMFGMMFGDVGQGAVIALAGLALSRRYARIAPVMAGAGFASIVFGFIYGSVFGYEELIHPIWISPLSDPMRMLSLALLWGILFIALMHFLTIYNLLSEARRTEALFGPKGVAGLTLYLGGVLTIYTWVEAGELRLWAALPAMLGLGSLVAYNWQTTGGTWGERTLVVAIEAFESITSYLSNTLSFLRVAAFSLNHVALAIAVFTLANSLEGAGHVLTVIVGNVFIIALEGAIVAIQVLRLEYYEGFSRFYRGDGREFTPLRLDPDPST